MKPAKLALEDGSVFEGLSFGASGERSGEVVFNTAMSGYQEILTDPSYKGQIVVMTYTQIGNYGINPEDNESSKPWLEGFAAREFSKIASNWRSSKTLEEYFNENNIMAIESIDTRALTRKIRITGSMNGVLSTEDLDDKSLTAKAKKIPSMSGLDLVKYVTRSKSGKWNEIYNKLNGKHDLKYKVALIDCGVKYNIVRLLVESSCDVSLLPATTTAKEILDGHYDGLCISNGPGDPTAVTYTIQTVKEVIKSKMPVIGICLGHQIIGAAMGANVYKLKFGHHGANHPVKNIKNGKIEITSQNHGFSVDDKSALQQGFEVTHINLNDGSVEGMRHKEYPVFCVQYHPESAPGPHDSRYLFEEFCGMFAEKK